MKLLTKLKSFIGNKIPQFSRGVLPSGGRSSVDDTFNDVIGGIESFYGIVEPDFPVDFLHVIDTLSVYHPDISKAVSDMVSIANSGHEVEVFCKQEGDIAAAMSRINTKAASIYPFSAGVDGLINQYIRQIFCFGALSSEDVIQPDLMGVEKVVTVPVRQIRFKRIDGREIPYQQTTTFRHKAGELGLIELNPETYKYYALFKTEKTPYGISPLLSGLMPLSIQLQMFPNLKQIMANMKLLGLNIAKIPPPPEDETDEKQENFQAKYRDHIKDWIDVLGTESYKHGFMGVPLDAEFQNFPVNTNMKGFSDIGNMVNRFLFTGIKSDAGLHNDHVSRTETFLLVIYKIFLHFAQNIRNIVKRRVERTYSLDLLLANMPFESISLAFKKDSALKPYVDRLAERTHSGTVINLLKTGIISPQRAANLLNEKEFYDEELFYKTITEAGLQAKKFTWNPFRQKYIPVETTLHMNPIPAAGNTEFAAAKTTGTRETRESRSFKKEETEEERAEKVRQKLDDYVERYLNKILPYYTDVSRDASDYASSYIQSNFEKVAENPELLRQAVIEYIREHPKIKNPDTWLEKTAESITVQAGKDFLENDFTAIGGKKPDFEFTFGQGDRNAMKFYAKLHTFFFSKFIDNESFGSRIDGFIRGFLERGEALHGKWTQAVEQEFIRLFGNAMLQECRIQVKRIVNTGIAQIKNRSHVIQLNLAGFEKGRINGWLETGCHICRAMHTQTIPIKNLMKQVHTFESAQTPEEALKIIKDQNIRKLEETDDIEKLIKSGKGLPPYHPNCRCFVEGYFEN